MGIPFTPEQMACVTAPPAPQVIVAGAGSGKTTVMAARVVWLVGTGAVAPEQVLGLTFTNKAAGELAERVRTALARAGITDPDPSPAEADTAGGEPRISTYHAFAGQLLKDHGLRIGLEPSARLLADATRFQLAARVLREAPGPYPALTKSVPDLVSDLLALDGELSEHLVTPERLRAYDTELLSALADVKLSNEDLRKVPEAIRGRLELLELVSRYRAAKHSRDLLDFGDQIALSAQLATTRPEVGVLLREEFRVVLLDEYQDTSVAQRLLLSGLFGGGTGHAVTAVGDPCQAIYGWRGASVANLDDFPEHFPYADGSPATRFSLSENRRSGGRLLDLANDLATPLRAMHEGVEALRPAPGAERDGSVRCALLETHAQELDWIGDSIAHLVRTGTEPREIAVLCRSGGDFARIQAVLVERDVPVEVVGLSGLLHLPEVADLVAVCEVLQDPGANAALVRLLIGPRWRIGARDLALLGRRARTLISRSSSSSDDDRLAAAVEGVDPAEIVSLADALETFLDGAGQSAPDQLPFSAAARVRFAHLAQELRDLRRSLADPLMDVLHRVLSATGLDVELASSPHALAARRRETLSSFMDVAAGFASLDGEASLLAFLAFLRTAAQYEKGLDHALPGGENTVKVLTAHKSKGLEWDVVVVPDLSAGSFPKEKAPEAWTSYAKVLPYALRGDAPTLPPTPEWTSPGLRAFKSALKSHKAVEELRLGYVTFTRPRSLLLASGHWWGPTQKKPRGPSSFLTALYEHCAAGHGEIEAWADAPAPDAENPSLSTDSTPDHSWPLPLDPASLTLRREAAALVESYLHPTRHAAANNPEDRSPQPLPTSPEDPYLWPPHCEDPAYDEEPPWPDPSDTPETTTVPWPDPVHGAAAADARRRDRTGEPEATAVPRPDPVDESEGTALPWQAPSGGATAADGPQPHPADEPTAADAGRPQAGAGRGTAVPAAAGGTPQGVRGTAPVSGRGGVGEEEAPPTPDAPWPPHTDAPVPHPHPAAPDADDLWPEAEDLTGARPRPRPSAPGDDDLWPEADDVAHTRPRPRPSAPGDDDLWPEADDVAHTRPRPRPSAPGDDDLWPEADDLAHTRPRPRPSAPGDDDLWPEADDLWPQDEAEPRAGDRAQARPRPATPGSGDDSWQAAGPGPLTPEDARAIASWDRDLDALEGELRRAREAVRDVELPSALSASQLLRLASDEQGFVRDLARPMPKPPQPAARQGTRFHAWVESRFEELPLPHLDVLDPLTDLPGAQPPGGDGSDQDIADEADLDSLKAAFERSAYADRTPYRMEVPVQITLAGRVIRGRIDAVYRNEEDGGYEIVDWKTGRTTEADPLQLAVYRLAWAEATNTPLAEVAAVFLHVRSGRVIRPRNLPGRARLEQILQGKTDTESDHRTEG
ncbi:UvrD-helicase domain-containing protein [Streptomyces sp. NBC_00335]|uniref:UvrD-helicase domain-containing protein n=1 Tax=unclassified Streptomyces TaxID=2593676 RepID=UPI00224E8AF8|nr:MULTISPECIES: UvrD-helicase domain-containing protein [unclassified Streptomyces]MCX5404754.1 UvrD-helicase domain-containing protein [Streptomyces sp. NBC_00086]